MFISSFYSINLIAFVKNKFMARITHLRGRCACVQVLLRTKLVSYRVEQLTRNFISSSNPRVYYLLYFSYHQLLDKIISDLTHDIQYLSTLFKLNVLIALLKRTLYMCTFSTAFFI